MRISTIEIDDDNGEHITRHGVTVPEIRDVLLAGSSVRRNRGGRAANYYAVANGVRVNFRYRDGVARPISAWRV